MKKIFVISIISLLLSCNSKKGKTIEKENNDSLVTYTYNKIILDQTLADFQNSFKKSENDIIFLGDSKTAGFPLQEIFNDLNLKNRGIAGNTTSNILQRLKNITSGHPKKIFLEIGVNDISNNIDLKEVFKNFSNICDRIKKESPNTKLYVQSVLPTTLENKGLNPKIINYNKLLKKFCEDKSIPYIDINSAFLNGKEMDEKYTYDGIHLNADGYFLWKKIIMKYVYE